MAGRILPVLSKEEKQELYNLPLSGHVNDQAMGRLLQQIDDYETALKDADAEVVRLARLLMWAYGQLGRKGAVIARWAQVVVSFKRFNDRQNFRYNGVEHIDQSQQGSN